MSRWTYCLVLLLAFAPVVVAQNYSEDLDSGIPANFTQSTTDVLDWQWTVGTTPSSGTGPSGDNTSGTGGYMYLEATGAAPGDDCILDGPVLDGTGGGVMLTFFYNMNGASMGDLEVYDFDGSSWSLVWSLSGNQGNVWTSVTVPLQTYGPNNRAQFRFRAVRGSGYQGDAAVDDISANVPPLPLYQVNQPGSSMDVNGATGNSQAIASSTIFNSCPQVCLNIASSQTGAPWDLAYSLGEAPDSLNGGSQTGEGQVINIDISGLGVSGPLFLNNPGQYVPNLATTAITSGQICVTLPQAAGTVMHAQMVVVDVTRPDGVSLSAPARAEWVADTIPTTLSLGDDDTAQVDLGCLGTFDWCGVPQSSFFVNSNGTVGFGNGDSSWNPSPAAAAAGAGRVGWWSDLSPQLGTVDVTQPTSSTVRVNFIGVPYFSPSSVASTYWIELDLASGSITIGGLGGLNGNTTGGGGGDGQWLGLCRGGVADPGPTVFGAGLTGGPGDCIYDYNDGTVAPVLPASVAAGMTELQFLPMGTQYLFIGS